MQQDQPFKVEHHESGIDGPYTSVRAQLRGKWNVVAMSRTELWIEDIASHKGIAFYVKIDRRTGRVNPHDGSMFGGGQDAGSRAWAKLPAYVRKFVEQHGNDMIAAKFPGTEDAKPAYNTINGVAMTGSHGPIA